jgi:hypothetical protein
MHEGYIDKSSGKATAANDPRGQSDGQGEAKLKQ